jgi:hypothetical protein
MKLSEFTISVLKNFSTINNGLVLKPGTVQKTMSTEKFILAEANLTDSFPYEFGIYDLPMFLGNVTTLENPTLEFNEQTVEMDDGSAHLSYFGCSTNLITSPPDKELELSKIDAEFDLSNATLQKLLRLGNMNNLPFLSIVGEQGKLKIKTHDNSDTSNVATITIGDYDGSDFVAKFKTEHLKLIQDDYHVKVALGAFATFQNQAKTLKYFVALQTK